MSSDERKRRTSDRPSASPEQQENRMVNLAMQVTEERLRSGRASSQEIVHFLKLGTAREALERDKLEAENKLLDAKVESLASQKRIEALYAEAMDAFRGYAGLDDSEIIE